MPPAADQRRAGARSSGKKKKKSKSREAAERLEDMLQAGGEAGRDYDPLDADGEEFGAEARAMLAAGAADSADDSDEAASGSDDDRRGRTLRAQADMDEVMRAYSGRVVSRRELAGSADEDEEDEEDEDGSGSGSDEDLAFGDTWGPQGDAEGSSSSEEGDDDDDDDEAAPRGGGGGGGVLAALQRLQKEDSAALVRRTATERDTAKAAAVRDQRKVWESVMDLRIRLQKPARAAARLPRPDKAGAFTRAGGKKLAAARQGVRESLHGLLGDLMEAQRGLSALHPAMPDLDEAAHTLAGVRAGDTDAAWARIEASQRAQAPHMEAVIDKWNRKTQLSSGRSALTGRTFKAVNQSVLAQINGIMQDEERLLKRSRLVRSDYRVLGEAPREAAAAAGEDGADELDGRREEYDPEVYDDGDFYQQLLREIISSGMDASGGDTESELLANARRARKRKRKQVDRRASKGRKLRYTVEPKLVNFTTPKPRDTTDLLVDELFAGLFGGGKAGGGGGGDDEDDAAPAPARPARAARAARVADDLPPDAFSSADGPRLI